MTPRVASVDIRQLSNALADQLSRVERLMLLLGWDQKTINDCTLHHWSLLNEVAERIPEMEKK